MHVCSVSSYVGTSPYPTRWQCAHTTHAACNTHINHAQRAPASRAVFKLCVLCAHGKGRRYKSFYVFSPVCMCRASVGVTATNVANGNAIVIATVRLRLTKYLVSFPTLTPADRQHFVRVYARAWKMHSYLPACCVFMAKFHVELLRYFQLNKGGFYAIYFAQPT